MSYQQTATRGMTSHAKTYKVAQSSYEQMGTPLTSSVVKSPSPNAIVFRLGLAGAANSINDSKSAN